MNFFDLALHLISFAAPALVLAGILPAAGRLLFGRRPATPSWWLQLLINALVGSLALGLSLWFFGRDGKMAAYITLVLAMASSEWFLMRAWQR